MEKLEVTNPSFFNDETIYQDVFDKNILKTQRGKIFDLISKKEASPVFLKRKQSEEIYFNGIHFIEEVIIKAKSNENLELYYIPINTDQIFKANLNYNDDTESYEFTIKDFISGIHLKNCNIADKIELKEITIKGLEKKTFEEVLNFANEKTYEYDEMKEKLLAQEKELIENEKNSLEKNNALEEKITLLTTSIEEKNKELAVTLDQIESENAKVQKIHEITIKLDEKIKDKNESLGNLENKVNTLKADKNSIEEKLKVLRITKSNYTEDLNGLQKLFDNQLTMQYVVFAACLIFLGGALFYFLKSGNELNSLILTSDYQSMDLKIKLMVGVKIAIMLTVGLVCYFIKTALAKSYKAIREIQTDRSESLKLAAMIKHAVDSVTIPESLTEAELQVYQDKLIQVKMSFLRQNYFNPTLKEFNLIQNQNEILPQETQQTLN